MPKQKKYMVVHNDSEINCTVIQGNWRKLARVESATWVRTYFNEAKGVRYCLWLAENEEQLKTIFTEMNVAWESIIEIEETVPDLWGEKWAAHLEAEETADTLGV